MVICHSFVVIWPFYPLRKTINRRMVPLIWASWFDWSSLSFEKQELSMRRMIQSFRTLTNFCIKPDLVSNSVLVRKSLSSGPWSGSIALVSWVDDPWPRTDSRIKWVNDPPLGSDHQVIDLISLAHHWVVDPMGYGSCAFGLVGPSCWRPTFCG